MKFTKLNEVRTSILYDVQWSPAIRPPRYYGHFFLFGCLAKTAVHFLVKKNPRLKYGQFLFGPMTAVLTGFHCTNIRGERQYIP